ncbi:hypothetical protein ACRALDRAFT_1056933 [Sodiomyces alcalophilus JCM 7366]|uniref:uncharacterized protein n=1 Tax=Sodiomyces alcalophilus JCM 7366 TaxID=591952 RepID=UPI0039B472A6
MGADPANAGATSAPCITLYDIAFASPCDKNTCAPNPWKARYALNFKGVTYSTEWVQMADIAKVRRGLGVPACRKFADGTDYYTLPVLKDPSTGSCIGDSFDIAHYLQTTYPDAGAGDLFPPQQLDYVCPGSILIPLTERSDNVHPEYVRFNDNVDMAFTLHVQLMMHGMRWDPACEAAIQAEFARRAGVGSWDDLSVSGEARDKLRASLRDTLRDLAAMYQRDTTGPFLLGSRPSYADIIVGGWLSMMSRTLPEHEWEEIQTWYDGVFGKLHAALQERFGDVK